LENVHNTKLTAGGNVIVGETFWEQRWICTWVGCNL